MNPQESSSPLKPNGFDKIQADKNVLGLTVGNLNRMYSDYSSENNTILEFQGDFAFTETLEQLCELMELTREVWYNSALSEANTIQKAANELGAKDDETATTIGMP